MQLTGLFLAPPMYHVLLTNIPPSKKTSFTAFWGKSVEPRYCRRMWTMLGRHTIVMLWNAYDPCNYSSSSVPVRAKEWKSFEAVKSSGTWILKTLSNTVAKRVNYGNHQWQVVYLMSTRQIHSWKYRMMLKFVLSAFRSLLKRRPFFVNISFWLN